MADLNSFTELIRKGKEDKRLKDTSKNKSGKKAEFTTSSWRPVQNCV